MKNKNKRIYFDNASSSPVDKVIGQEFLKMMQIFGNSGSIHKEGVLALRALFLARRNVAKILQACESEIIFTSSGTESNNLAILGVIGDWKLLNKKIPHIITTNIEHSSVLETCKYLNDTKQAQVTILSVGENGFIEPKKIYEAIKSNTILVSIGYANNEIGVIQPIKDIARQIRRFRKVGKRSNLKDTPRFDLRETFPLFHTDAVQATNYLDINVNRLGVDLMTINSSKIYGPKGVGVLYKKTGVQISPIMFGGDQEFGLRPGTQNVSAITAFSHALEITEKIKIKESKRLTILRDYFIKELKKKFLQIKLNGDAIMRLPNNINISVPDFDSETLALYLDADGFAVSSQSACKDDKSRSFVISAINPNFNFKKDGILRISLGRTTKREDIGFFIKSLTKIFKLHYTLL